MYPYIHNPYPDIVLLDMVGVVIADHIRVADGAVSVNNFLHYRVLSVVVGQLSLQGDSDYRRFNLPLLLSLPVPT